MRRVVIIMVLMLGLGACDWFGDEEPPRLPGERIPVMLFDAQLEPDPRISDLSVRLPPPEINAAWPQPGGYADHAMHHLSVSEVPELSWSQNIGQGSTDEQRLLAQPVVADGQIFAMDAEARVSAFEVETGQILWTTDVISEDEEEGDLGGGLAVAGDQVFVTTGAAQVLALNRETGVEIWRQTLSAPMRSGPTIAAGRVFAVTVDNQVHTLDARDGRKLWTHSGITETAGLLGGASPAVSAGIVVVPYSSGELIALRIDNGRPVWTDSLAAVQRVDAVSALADIHGHPIMDRGWVISVSHSGRMATIDLRTGVRVWDKNIGGVETPWVAGDFIFMLTNGSEFVCLSRRDGRIRWIQPLQRYEDEEDKEDVIYWVGPVLASDRLIVANSTGQVLSISPYDGAILGLVQLSDGVRISPVVANDALFVLTEGADLIAFK